jgi:GT2 family glycosyltransferase
MTTAPVNLEPTPDTPDVYVLLPVHNRRALTERYVRCLAEQSYPRIRLVLIDDGSTDGTAEMATSHLPDAIVLRGTGDWWWGGGLQQGLDWLQGAGVRHDAVILMTNDDLTIEADFVAHGVAMLRTRPRTLLLARVLDAGQIVEPGQHFDAARLSFTTATSPEDVNCLSTQGLFLRWRDAREIGGFHPRWLPHYLSDYEYTIRAHRLGLRLETTDELLVDLNQETTGFHRIEEVRFTRFLRKFFSVKSPANPVHWSVFILLACPVRFWPRHLFVLWKNVLYRVFVEFVRSVKHARADRPVRL